jgi:hypothetical protein
MVIQEKSRIFFKKSFLLGKTKKIGLFGIVTKNGTPSFNPTFVFKTFKTLGNKTFH